MLDSETLDHLKEITEVLEIQTEAITQLTSAVLALSVRLDLLEKGE